LHWAWPWNDRQGRLSPLKLTTFLASFLPAIWLTDQVYEQNFGLFPLAGMTYWSGVWSMAFLLLALCVTPAAKVFRWPRLTILRRMVGVTALVYTIAHIIIYFALRMWDFVSIGNEMITRLSLIIATLSTIGIVALGVTSFDEAIKRMGSDGWNRLHNTVYVLTLMALIHYILSPGIYPSQYWMSGMFLWLMLWRWLDRQGRGTSIAMLFLLAIGTTLFTALFEAFWINIYQDFEFSSTLSNNFTLTFGISAAWKNLAVGLAVVVLALFAQARRPRHLPSSA
jgi:sulfoxide reductase heme-binding subunit YedZ